MIGKIVGAFAGKKLAERSSGVSGTGGLVMGAAATSILKRVGPLGLIAALAGGYVIKRQLDQKSPPYGRASKY